jgi:Protein of unknown function (DUF2690)
MSKKKFELRLSFLSVMAGIIGIISSLLSIIPSSVLKNIAENNLKNLFENQQAASIFAIITLLLLVLITITFLFREVRSTATKSSVFLVVTSAIVCIGAAFLTIFTYLQTPSCQAFTCAELDARYAGCVNSAFTAANATLGEINVELRLSPNCKAGWARAKTTVGATLYVENKDGQVFGRYVVPDDGIENHYGNMAPAPANYPVRACVQYPQKAPLCTNYATQ